MYIYFYNESYNNKKKCITISYSISKHSIYKEVEVTSREKLLFKLCDGSTMGTMLDDKMKIKRMKNLSSNDVRTGRTLGTKSTRSQSREYIWLYSTITISRGTEWKIIYSIGVTCVTSRGWCEYLVQGSILRAPRLEKSMLLVPRTWFFSRADIAWNTWYETCAIPMFYKKGEKDGMEENWWPGFLDETCFLTCWALYVSFTTRDSASSSSSDISLLVKET